MNLADRALMTVAGTSSPRQQPDSSEEEEQSATKKGKAVARPNDSTNANYAKASKKTVGKKENKNK